MRDTSEEFNGYEVQTEGDSFQLAFSSVAAAIRFCVSVQHKFLEFNWSQDIIKLPFCSVVKDARGKNILFRGPRIRMAIHWARKDLFSRKFHSQTKHEIFEGPAFEVAKELCDAASGGQILLSQDAWTKLYNDFPRSGFPTVEQLGLYVLSNWPEAMHVYNITQRVGKRLVRTFSNLRKLEYVTPSRPLVVLFFLQVEPGMGIYVIPPPAPDNRGMLTFVALRIKTSDDVNGTVFVTASELFTQYAQYYTGYVFEEDRAEVDSSLMWCFD